MLPAWCINTVYLCCYTHVVRGQSRVAENWIHRSGRIHLLNFAAPHSKRLLSLIFEASFVNCCIRRCDHHKHLPSTRCSTDHILSTSLERRSCTGRWHDFVTLTDTYTSSCSSSSHDRSQPKRSIPSCSLLPIRCRSGLDTSLESLLIPPQNLSPNPLARLTRIESFCAAIPHAEHVTCRHIHSDNHCALLDPQNLHLRINTAALLGETVTALPVRRIDS